MKQVYKKFENVSGNLCEDWRDVLGFDGKYQVSSKGRVRSLPFETYSGSGRYRTVRPKILKTKCCNHGYPKVSLCNKTCRVHTLVAEAFLMKPEIGGYHGATVNHIDGNKQNNHVENLEWVSIEENLRHARDVGLNLLNRENNPVTKVTYEDVIFVHVCLLKGFTQKEIADFINMTHQWVSKIKRGLLWKGVRVEHEQGKYVLYDQQTPEQERQGCLETVFLDGELVKETSLQEIRQRVKDSL